MSFYLLFFLLLAGAFVVPSLQRKDPVSIRISCGSRVDVHTPPANTLWYKDYAYTGGRPENASRTSAIAPSLSTLRYFPLSDGPNNCYIVKNVPNGHYAVRVFFAFVSDLDLDNEPLFDVSIEGTQIHSLKPDWSMDDEQSFLEALVFVKARTVSLCFHSTGHGDPSILSIEILQVDDNGYNFGPQWSKEIILRTVKRVNSGDSRPAYGEDYGANRWGGDRFWLPIHFLKKGSDRLISSKEAIHRVSVSPNFYPERLYRFAIVSTDAEPDLTFSMDVDPNKIYSIWLHFAEIEAGITGKGQRVFDILINGNAAFKDVDIVNLAGGPSTALVLNKTITVDGRSLTITMHPTIGKHALVNAIEIFEVIAQEFPTIGGEVRTLQTLKSSLGLPLRLGWNGDPCVPQQHPWTGVDCQYLEKENSWAIDGLGLDNQGLKGTLPAQISKLSHLQSINFSGNSIQGVIPASLGSVAGLETLDLSFNLLNGTIPESLGQLKSLRRLNLNGNSLTGRVPAAVGGRLLHRASFNFTDNAGLCGIPGLPPCGPRLSLSSKIGIGVGILFAALLILLCSACWWKRRQNILRAQKLAAREAPYAKARTVSKTNGREVQLGRQSVLDYSRNVPTENGASRLLPNSP